MVAAMVRDKFKKNIKCKIYYSRILKICYCLFLLIKSIKPYAQKKVSLVRSINYSVRS
jgi:hypothetical protein